VVVVGALVCFRNFFLVAHFSWYQFRSWLRFEAGFEDVGAAERLLAS
jgi:hypothetical protein